MPDVVLFRRGCDLRKETRIEDEDTVTCLACSKVQSDEVAHDGGWQLVPPVCPDCLRWELVEEAADA